MNHHLPYACVCFFLMWQSQNGPGIFMQHRRRAINKYVNYFNNLVRDFAELNNKSRVYQLQMIKPLSVHSHSRSPIKYQKWIRKRTQLLEIILLSTAAPLVLVCLKLHIFGFIKLAFIITCIIKNNFFRSYCAQNFIQSPPTPIKRDNESFCFHLLEWNECG